MYLETTTQLSNVMTLKSKTFLKVFLYFINSARTFINFIIQSLCSDFLKISKKYFRRDKNNLNFTQLTLAIHLLNIGYAEDTDGEDDIYLLNWC